MKTISNFIGRHPGLITVLVVGFLASFTYAFYFRVNVTVDARAYDSIAMSLVNGTGYTETTRPELPEVAIGRLGPGYEFFLAGIYALFGHRIWVVWIIQSLLHTCSAFMVYLLCRRFLKTVEWPAVLSAAIYIFYIDLLEFPAMLLTETLYLFLVLASVHFAFNFIERTRGRDVIFSSTLFTLAVLVRPPVTIAMMVFLGYLIFKKHYRHALIFAIVAVVLLTPWTVRNYLRYHKFIVTSSIIGYDIWMGNNPESIYVGELTGTDEINKYTDEQGLFAANERGKQEVFRLLTTQPLKFISLQLTKTSIYFSAARPAAFWFHIKGIVQAGTIVLSSSFAFLIFVFGMAGLWRFAWKKDDASRMFVLLTLAAPVGIIWVVAETRYRYQIYPMLIVLGALFLHDFLKDKKSLAKVLIVSLVLVFANTTLDLFLNSSRVLERVERVLGNL